MIESSQKVPVYSGKNDIELIDFDPKTSYDTVPDILGSLETNKLNFADVKFGSESLVIQTKERSDILFAHTFANDAFKPEFDRKPENVRLVFDTHRILNILFPKNFPKFMAIFNATELKDKYPENYLYSTIRQKITGTHILPESGNPAVSNLLSFLNDNLKIDDVDKGFDWTIADNFMQTESGDIYFLDILTDEFCLDLFSKKRDVISYMQKNSFSERDIETVENIFERHE